MSAPLRSRPGSRSVNRTYHQRTGADVRLLVLIALVSLVVALGLYAWLRVEAVQPSIEERQRRMEQAADAP
jgi:uncharacterized protein HemX